MKIALYLVLISASVGLTAPNSAAARSPSSCVTTTANGTGATEKIAKFQVYEGLLQSADMSLWAAWVADGTLQGYAVKPVKYHCDRGSGLGVSCRGRTTICKR